MNDLIPVIVAGIMSGSAYALLALGVVIIFRSTDTVNFAIGDIATLGVFVAISLIGAGVPTVIALIVCIIFSGLLGVAAERVLIRPLGGGGGSLFIALVVTIGLGLIIHAVINTIWGHRPLPLAPIVSGTVTILGVALTWSKVIATGIAIVAMIAVSWLFQSTMIGTAMRATADDHFAARIVGLKPHRIASLSWFLGCSLASISVFFLATDTSATASMTVGPLFRAFAGVFLGGLTSLPGAAIGSFAIGILDNVVGRYVSASYRDTIVFAVIVVVLFARPAGFLGAARKVRV
jgi:branched-chain amino acid transport system permease protein